MVKRTRLPVLLILLGLLSVFGCSTQRDRSTLATPTPPADLLTLPRDVQVICHNDPNLDRGTVNVWELPGLEPSDPNSAYQGRRGNLQGELSWCTPVKVSDYAWSETDREFYVHVAAGSVQGWILLKFISFNAPLK